MSGNLRSRGLRVVSSSISANLQPDYEPSECAIVIKNATLEYPLGPFVKGSLKSKLLGVLGHRENGPKAEYVTALNDVSLEFAYGERVAVIGRNGAGKSSILRALAGVYPLSRGSINVVGQIGTLLDIGLGFEPESTGRENIYYRGMSMGYSRAQLKAVESEIIEFANLGEFIDLPVRTYSSGMYVRLGFAVSTQFSPEVLLIDEVFSAGDAAFTARALKRMDTMVNKARIMITATHDLGLVERVCTRVIWMDDGRVHRDGTPDEILPEFKSALQSE